MGARQSLAGKGWIFYLVGGAVVMGAYYLAGHLHAGAALGVALYCLVSASAAVMVLIGSGAACLRAAPGCPWLFLG